MYKDSEICRLGAEEAIPEADRSLLNEGQLQTNDVPDQAQQLYADCVIIGRG